MSSLWYGEMELDHVPSILGEGKLTYQEEEFQLEVEKFTTKVIQTILYENMTKMYTKELLDAQMQNAYLKWKENGGNIFYYLEDEMIENEACISWDYLKQDEKNNSELSYQAFEKLNPNLRNDLKKCMEQNFKIQYEKNQDFIKANTMFKATVIAKEHTAQWKKTAEQYKSYPFYILYQNGTEFVKRQETDEHIQYRATTNSSAHKEKEYIQLNRIYLPFIKGSMDTENMTAKEIADIQDVEQIYDTWMKKEIDIVLSKYQIGIGMEQEVLEQQQQTYQVEKQEQQKIVFAMIIMGIAFCIGVLYLMITTGMRRYDEEIHLNLLDSIWSEIQAIVGFFILLFSVWGMDVIGNRYAYPNNGQIWKENEFLELFGHPKAEIIIGIVTAFVTFLFGTLILSQIRRLKARQWWNGFITIRIIKVIWKKLSKGLITIWRGGRLMNRMTILAIVIPIVSATWIGIPFAIAGLLYLVYRYVPDFECLQEGIKTIRKGDVAYQISIDHEGIIKEMAEDVNQISEGLQEAIVSEVRSERMKAELISNVSHDIKTPLTSIITYVDLLKKEELENETAKEYIHVIEKKAQRLKLLTDDLFEAAKASSGDMPVHLEKVNMQSLIQQALGEFDDKLKDADLSMRITIPEQPVEIVADGRLMWRVLSNLLSNVVKYAQTGSRVYLSVEEEGETNQVCMTIKNISAYELNMEVEELLERFTRGDESRSTEGSGLGLNIANSFIELQHGTFTISIDGDLFKVMIQMPRFQEG